MYIYVSISHAYTHMVRGQVMSKLYSSDSMNVFFPNLSAFRRLLFPLFLCLCKKCYNKPSIDIFFWGGGFFCLFFKSCLIHNVFTLNQTSPKCMHINKHVAYIAPPTGQVQSTLHNIAITWTSLHSICSYFRTNLQLKSIPRIR